MPVTRAGSLQFSDLPGRASANALPAGVVDGVSARVVRIAPGIRTPHRHPRSGEVVYVVAGRGVAWEDGMTTDVSAGDIIAIPRGVPHATAAAAGSELVLVCFFPDAELSTNLEELDGPEVRA